MPQAISYIRFSSAQQRHGSSVERQESSFEDWLHAHPDFQPSDLGWIDRGKSAFSGQHTQAGLGQLLFAIQNGQINKGDAIVIEAIDRLSRQPFTDAFEIIQKIVKAGVSIHTVEDGQIYSEETINSTAIYVLASKINAAWEYSRRLSARIAASYERKEAKAKAGERINAPNRPYWIDDEGKLDSSSAEIPLKIIDLYKKGMGQLEILKILSSEYVNSPHIPTTTRSIKRLLTNPALIGQWKGVVAFEALIPISEYLSVQELVTQRATFGSPEDSYLLSGLIRCRNCGSSYNFRRQKARTTVKAPIGSREYREKGDIVYANCSNFLKKGTCDNSFTVPYEVAELVFSRTSELAIFSIAMGIAMGTLNRTQYGELKAERLLLAQRIERHRNLYAALGNESDLRKLTELKTRLDLVEKQVQEQEQKASVSKVVQQTFTEDDFLLGTDDQRAFHKATQEALTRLEENEVNFRNELKAYGYSIKAGRTLDAKCNGSLEASGNSYVITRRSQKDKCYYVLCEEFDDMGSRNELTLPARRKSVEST